MFKNSDESPDYYLIEAAGESPTGGTAVDESFISSQVRVLQYSGKYFEFKVWGANQTWFIECELPSTSRTTGQALFNLLYGDIKNTRRYLIVRPLCVLHS